MEKNNIRYIIIAFLLSLLVGYYIYYKEEISKNKPLPVGGMEVSINDSSEKIEVFCKDLENQLIEYKAWDTDKWKCVVAYDPGLNVSDIVYNKTRGLCNCTATLKNGEKRTVEVRQSK